MFAAALAQHQGAAVDSLHKLLIDRVSTLLTCTVMGIALALPLALWLLLQNLTLLGTGVDRTGSISLFMQQDDPAALHNLGRLSRGALYVEAVSLEDYEQDIIDEHLTDNRVFRHRAALYRRGLREGFVELGGGVWLSHQAEVPTFALERSGGPG